MRKGYNYILISGTFAIWGCVKPFTPTSISTNANILVVEGLINTTDSITVKLSRTVIVANKSTANAETKAIVTIENAQATVGTLTETTKGTYVTRPLLLDNTKQYRVRIKTSNGKTYLSDLTDAKVTPPIDSIGYTITGTGLQIYANAHDATNNTRYYKYAYHETWQFNARFPTSYISDGVSLQARTPAQQIFYCYGNDTSANVVLNSTAALSLDVVYQSPITTIDATSEKIGSKYSILLSQQALTKDAYTFWSLLKKNTEQLGSIFDAQPSQLTGNIHNTNDASEPVIGYISAGTIQKKRIYIIKTQLPPAWQVVYPYTCQIDTGINTRLPPPPPIPYLWMPPTVIDLPVHGYVTGIVKPGPDPINPTSAGAILLYTSVPCADCTIRGTTTKPAFWK